MEEPLFDRILQLVKNVFIYYNYEDNIKKIFEKS